jgi:hypothetical protein
MTWQAILLEAVKLAPSELALLEQGIVAVRSALAQGQTEEQAVQAARAVIDTALDAFEAAEK